MPPGTLRRCVGRQRDQLTSGSVGQRRDCGSMSLGSKRRATIQRAWPGSTTVAWVRSRTRRLECMPPWREGRRRRSSTSNGSCQSVGEKTPSVARKPGFRNQPGSFGLNRRWRPRGSSEHEPLGYALVSSVLTALMATRPGCGLIGTMPARSLPPRCTATSRFT
jgi:hypothetical protein